MRITGTTSPSRTSASRKSRGSSGAGSTFNVETSGAARGQSVSGPRPLMQVDALIALQEVPDAMAERKRAVQRGEDMLDLMESIKIGLLSGGLAMLQIKKLTKLVESHDSDALDPELKSVLEEIELRARVELAKLERAA